MDPLFGDELVQRPIPELPPGAHFVPGFLTLEQQRWIVGQFHRWVEGPVPLHSTTIRGNPMSVRTVCLGWHWRPTGYTREAVDVNGRRVLDFPDWMGRLGRRALTTATGDESAAVRYRPDTALVNFYDSTARMGMHQDKDEKADDPVVSLSIGDSCRFRFGNTETRNRPYQDLELRSGDLFVFGGPSRLAFHGVLGTRAGTAPDGCGLTSGRINITMRVTGLSG
ncbi:alpha-ketoglutarate-dependent dioxygenase AlkB [Helcobacillus massiliensis]|uniref:Alkylated DNA repair protein (DNA oxidative demethylase) n=1 Tax=Helcobacillus massiliensis TaxID=521392 RepID=A0A839QV13_9MICO|nr:MULTISPECIES: alpha-ketoglutarate-dependent dioxygenase AlkB [Helcobacillus]MBB3022620.1 alkylated DNA repair protein (DNA oxidative demethylase) [Helcobacillus massiliensis]MCG7427611.1 alpha-ketoglutarate-dependent dioxygenase AlkB [Helcobacillus sp. ACRRO]MCT1558675.1 alpha-ketoglutarate-dependent dioxygenase AlkB [Helcobacillus massiliensis]MCT2037289.1 alpha-ketoglutarate-dependent dioxygenase AlkB [Helcobacillus massiliensis]MCT2332897.1 alpha-ketoglutarate-dependent dioxygenase AlkB 